MCSPPKAPQVTPIPDRRVAVMPDGGDPSVRMADRNKRRLTSAAMIFSNQGTLGAPSVTGGGY